MRIVYKALIILTIVFSIKACAKEEITERDYPRLWTLEATDITQKGATFKARIPFRGNFQILQYGFVWSESEYSELTNSEKVVFTGNIQSEEFSATITAALKEGVEYYVKAFLITENYTVYGKVVKFMSLGSGAPEVHSFLPLSANWGDTIQITGRNFSYMASNNKVKFGQADAPVLEASDTLLSVKVPAEKNTNAVKLSVSIHGNAATAGDEFHYLIPAFRELSPARGTFNDTISISGMNFPAYTEHTTVLFGSEKAAIISAHPSHIKVLVPEALDLASSKVTVISAGHTLADKSSFELEAPVITSFGPDTVFSYNEIITLNGAKFNPDGQYNKVKIDGHEALVVQASSTHLKVVLPNQIIPHHIEGRRFSVIKDVDLQVSIAGQTAIAPTKLTVYWHSTWTKKNDFPGPARHTGVAFAIGDKGYYGTGISGNDRNGFNDFWEYDPETDQWSKIDELPGAGRGAAVSFVLNGRAYVGLGSENIYRSYAEHLNDFYCFDPAARSWARIADFQGGSRHSASSFVVQQKAFVGTGFKEAKDISADGTLEADDFWQYNPVSNTWQQSMEFPVATQSAVGFNIGQQGYVYNNNNNTLYKWTDNGWVVLNAPGLNGGKILAFSINQTGFLGLGNELEKLLTYEPHSENSMEYLFGFEERRYGASVFVIKDKAYVIGGVNTQGNGIQYLNEVWEFDPTKPLK